MSFIPGFKNIDISSNAEIVLDVGKEPLPFDDSSVDLVYSYHTIEHVPDYLFVMKQIFRVLKDGGTLLMGVPYVTLTEYNLVNPYHLHHFNEHSFSFFDPTKLRGSAVEDSEIYFHKVFHRLHYMGAFKLLPPPFRTWSRRHLFNVVSRIDYGVIAIKSESTLGHLPRAADLRSQFEICRSSCVFYNADDTRRKSVVRRARRWWRGV